MHRLNRLLCLAAALLVVVTASSRGDEKEDGFEPLFDGKSLKGWDGDPELWSVVGGAIVGKTTDDKPIENNQFLIWDGKVDNFVLRAEFRIADKGVGNSGIQYRSQKLDDVGKWVMGGYQSDIERTNQYMGIMYEERGRGILALRGEDVVLSVSDDDFEKEVVGQVGDAAKIVEGVRAGEWQTMEVVANGNDLTHKLNGKVTVHVVDEDTDNAVASGLVGLQLHAGPAMQIEFRNIRLKKLPASDNTKTK